MDNMTKELTIFIKRWIYCLCTPDGSKVFFGVEALHDEKKKLFVEGETDYKLAASAVPGLADACLGDVYKVTAKEEIDPIHGYQWQIISAKRTEPAVDHEIRKFMTQTQSRASSSVM